jgi:copper chaperone CopZ
MRIRVAAIGILSLLGLSAAAQQTTDKPVVLKVAGMWCGACAKTVEKEARKIDGVKVAKVSQSKGEAEITYDRAKTSPEAIAKRITQKTGFKTEPPKKP